MSASVEFEGAPPGRVWEAAMDAVGVFGYAVQHSDKKSRILTFRTGRSWFSRAGQDVTVTITKTDSGSSMTLGGSLAVAHAGQLVAGGEKQRLIKNFIETVSKILPTIPEKPKKEKQAASSGSASTADELVKLAALRDSGVLTTAEFEEQKAKLLG